MADSFEEQGWVKMGVAAALAKEFAADERRFLGVLAETLQQAFPNETKVIKKGLFTKTTVGVELTLDEYRYKIEETETKMLRASRIKIVRGIALKTDDIPMEQCLEEVAETLERRAQQSAGNRTALARLLGLE